MNSIRNDLVMSLIFMTGIFGFISGEFIVSTLLLASAAIYSNIMLTLRLK